MPWGEAVWGVTLADGVDAGRFAIDAGTTAGVAAVGDNGDTADGALEEEADAAGGDGGEADAVGEAKVDRDASSGVTGADGVGGKGEGGGALGGGGNGLVVAQAGSRIGGDRGASDGLAADDTNGAGGD